jgi:DNA-binding CsgD family transcriptional regulator
MGVVAGPCVLRDASLPRPWTPGPWCEGEGPEALMYQLDRLRARLRAAEAALDHVRSAVFVLDAAAVVLFANRPARALLADGGGLRLLGRRLCAAVNGDSAHLSSLIAAALGSSQAARVHTLPIRRGAGRLPLLAVALPAARESSGVREVLLFVADPAAQRCAAAELLREALHLTDREVCVALATVRLGSVPAAAAELGIALTTARSHLQHVFDKTGARNQVALAQMLAALGALPDARDDR